MATKDKKPEVNVVSKVELKADPVKLDVKILEQKLFRNPYNGAVSTWTKKRESNGSISETYGEQDGRATSYE